MTIALIVASGLAFITSLVLFIVAKSRETELIDMMVFLSGTTDIGSNRFYYNYIFALVIAGLIVSAITLGFFIAEKIKGGRFTHPAIVIPFRIFAIARLIFGGMWLETSIMGLVEIGKYGSNVMQHPVQWMILVYGFTVGLLLAFTSIGSLFRPK